MIIPIQPLISPFFFIFLHFMSHISNLRGERIILSPLRLFSHFIRRIKSSLKIVLHAVFHELFKTPGMDFFPKLLRLFEEASYFPFVWLFIDQCKAKL
ncbi:MAG: hypothetical protein PWP05_502 [Thermovirga sp.]|nr:hypothetical protein [Thermovirga sp.]MDN5367787.1 hypothetical protein [Thermovirga sp.]